VTAVRIGLSPQTAPPSGMVIGVSLTQLIADEADELELAFLWNETHSSIFTSSLHR
jgi:hypothetical protein